MRDWRSEIRGRLAAGNIHPANEVEIVEELGQHLDDQFAELRTRGVSEERATAALLEQLDAPGFPGDVLARNRARAGTPPAIIVGGPNDARSFVASAWQDVRYGFRSLRKSPAFTAVAVVSLGLGIGATTAIFGLLHTVLLARMPVSRPEQLVSVQFAPGTERGGDQLPFTQYKALEKAPGMPTLAGSTGGTVAYVIRNTRDYSPSEHVTGGYYEVVGVRPLFGRTITAEDDVSGAPVTVISEDLWRTRFEADPAVLGQTMTLNGQAFTVVGVLPRSYRGMYLAGSFSIALPLGARRLVVPPNPDMPEVYVSVIGRLASGMSRERASEAIDRAYRQCCPSAARAPAGADADQPLLIASDASRGLTSMKSDLRGQYRRVLLVLMAGVAIVLLIACANVGNLLLARAAARRREIAVRMSMGATRARLVQQLLVESVELAIAGGILGLLLARLGTGLLAHNLPPVAVGLSDLVTLRPSATILAFTAAITLGATLLFGIVPAFRATRADIVTPLKDGAKSMSGHRWWSLDRGLVVAQVALALVLVCTAGLFVATLRNLREFDSGYSTSRVLMVYVDARTTSWESRGMNPIYPEVLARAQRIPGVERVTAAMTVPLFGGRSRSRIGVSGYQPAADEDMGSWNNSVTPGYFATTGIRLRAGREFDASDTESSEPVAIVSEAFAKRFFAGRDPIGGFIMLRNWRPARQARIAGVASDARYFDLRTPAEEFYYVPLSQAANQTLLIFALRTTGDPVDIASSISREINAVAPGIRLRRLAGIEEVMNEALSRERLSAALASLFGVFALVLAAVGLYGVIAYNVARRTSEIGIRMALGATPRHALWLVLRQTLVMVAIGLGVGVPLALAASRAIGAQLYGIDSSDPRAMIAAATLLAIAAAVASIVPGRRAASVDPVEALRAD